MEELLIALVQMAVEIIAEAIFSLPWNLAVSSSERRASDQGRALRSRTWYVFSLIAGAVAGGISLLAMPRAFSGGSALRLAGLVAAPFFSAGLAFWIAKAASAGRRPWNDPNRHAICVFLFTAAVSAIRFGWAQR